MNITPALPSPYHPSNDQDRQAVGSVRASTPTRDATDDAERRRDRPPAIDRVERERLVEQAETDLQRYHGAETARANRALASYAQVAEDDKRRGLQDLLGFDAYA